MELYVKKEQKPRNCLSCPFRRKTSAGYNYCQAYKVTFGYDMKSKSTVSLYYDCPLMDFEVYKGE